MQAGEHGHQAASPTTVLTACVPEALPLGPHRPSLMYTPDSRPSPTLRAIHPTKPPPRLNRTRLLRPPLQHGVGDPPTSCCPFRFGIRNRNQDRDLGVRAVPGPPDGAPLREGDPREALSSRLPAEPQRRGARRRSGAPPRLSLSFRHCPQRARRGARADCLGFLAVSPSRWPKSSKQEPLPSENASAR